MKIMVCDEKKRVEVWLTKAEKEDTAIQKQMKCLYEKYKSKKYLVAVFQSGNQDLYQSTLDLLAYNKKRVAQIAVQREKTKTHCLERSM